MNTASASSKSLAMAALAGATAVALTLPSVAQADPEPIAGARPAAAARQYLHARPACRPAAPPPPADPAAPPPPADPNAPPPPPADPNAPRRRLPIPTRPPPRAAPGARPRRQRRGRLQLRGARRLEGLRRHPAVLRPGAADRTRGHSRRRQQGTPPNDTSVLLGRLDMKLFAGAEADNAKAATRLASDMGEFFMPFPGTRSIRRRAARRGRHARRLLRLRGEVHRHQQADGPDLGGRGRYATPVAPGSTPRGQRTPSAGSWSGSAPRPTRWTRRRRHAGQLDPAVDSAAAARAGPERAAAADPNAPPPDPNAPPPERPGSSGCPCPVDPDSAPEMMPAG